LSLVITIIAGAGAEPLLPDCVGEIRSALGASEPDWLAPGRACDLLQTGDDAAAAETAARQAIGDAAIDMLVQPTAGRRKRVFVADLESTVIENEMLDELADFVGLRVHVAEITRRAMNAELDFAAALTERVALLKGLPAAVLDEAASRIRLMPGARALLATLRTAGVRTALVSGGFTVFADRIGAELGFEQIVANRLDIADGRITGTVAAPIMTRETKRDTLLRLAQQSGVPLAATLAIGDGANDLAMLQEAGLGVAFHAKPAVAAAAHARVDHCDLTALLYAQGYRRDEFTESPPV
jgi:phosphoserine phosphatase